MSRSFSIATLAVAMALWVPLALTTTPFRLPGPTWPYQLGEIFVALALLARTRGDLASRRVPTLVACAKRSVVGAVVVGASTWFHVLAGGGAFLTNRSLFVVAGAVLGLLLGPLAVFEHRAASRTTRRSALVASALAGWASFVGLCGAWVQAHYLTNVLSSRGTQAVLDATQKGAWWLFEDPAWTLRHFGFSAVPFAAFTWARLRGWSLARQVAFGLAATGATWGLFPGGIPAVTFGLALLPFALPVVAWVADRRHAPPPRDPAEEPSANDEHPSAIPWVFAVILCALAAVALAGREGYRASRRAELTREVAERLPAWRAVLEKEREPELRAHVDELARDVAPVRSALATVPTDAGERARVAASLAVLEERRLALEGETERRIGAIGRGSSEVDELMREVGRNGGGSDDASLNDLLRWKDERREESNRARMLAVRIQSLQIELAGLRAKSKSN